jgi:hypothetical protein
MPVGGNRLEDLCDCMSMHRSTGNVHLKAGYFATSIISGTKTHRSSAESRPFVEADCFGYMPPVAIRWMRQNQIMACFAARDELVCTGISMAIVAVIYFYD